MGRVINNFAKHNYLVPRSQL